MTGTQVQGQSATLSRWELGQKVVEVGLEDPKPAFVIILLALTHQRALLLERRYPEHITADNSFVSTEADYLEVERPFQVIRFLRTMKILKGMTSIFPNSVKYAWRLAGDKRLANSTEGKHIITIAGEDCVNNVFTMSFSIYTVLNLLDVLSRKGIQVDHDELSLAVAAKRLPWNEKLKLYDVEFPIYLIDYLALFNPHLTSLKRHLGEGGLSEEVQNNIKNLLIPTAELDLDDLGRTPRVLYYAIMTALDSSSMLTTDRTALKNSIYPWFSRHFTRASWLWGNTFLYSISEYETSKTKITGVIKEHMDRTNS